MSIYDSLLEVESCCYCISVKAGSFLIALFVIGGTIALSTASVILDLCQESSTMQSIMEYGSYVVLGVAALLFICSCIFLIGLCMDKYITAIIFLHALAFFSLVIFVYLVLDIVAIVVEPKCRTDSSYGYLGVAIISLILAIYFMIIVRSHKDVME